MSRTRDRRPASVDSDAGSIARRIVAVCSGLADLDPNGVPVPARSTTPRRHATADPTGSTVVSAEAWLARQARHVAEALGELDAAALTLQVDTLLDRHIRWLAGPKDQDAPRPRDGWISAATTGRLNVVATDTQTTVETVRQGWHHLHQTEQATQDDDWRLSLSRRAIVDCASGLKSTMRALQIPSHGLPLCPGCGRVHRARLEGTDRHRECRTCRRHRTKEAA